MSASPPMDQELRFSIANDLRELSRVHALAESFLHACAAPPRTVYLTNLALEEMLSNVIRHGYADGRAHSIRVGMRADDTGIEVRIVDDGRAFDPTQAPGVDTHAVSPLPGSSYPRKPVVDDITVGAQRAPRL